ncbi:hypothetical protein BDZ97DRAFT_1753343 [Flammula alnicola]|nr:hypothetical protein BDZ97DRAFT_1753343 [Flammula alnicola]
MPSITANAKASLVLLFVLNHLALASPVPFPQNSNQIDNAYSGAGGHASGGSINKGTGGSTGILGGLELVDAFSHNAGNGGTANSGNSVAGGQSVDIGGDQNTAAGSTANAIGNTYTGVGGTADGGSVNGDCGGLINLSSCNAGNGGKANSGASGPLAVAKSTKTKISRIIHLRLD